jgi:hypothetical protein
MANKSLRLQRQLRKERGPDKPVALPYVILDEYHRPDLRGEFAGVRVVARDGKPVVHLLPEQAKFYLDQGAIAPLSS